MFGFATWLDVWRSTLERAGYRVVDVWIDLPRR